MIQEKGEAFSLYRGEENPLSHAFFVVVKDSSGDDDGVSLSIEYLIRMEIAKTPRLRLPLLLRLIRAFNQAENPESLFFPPDDRKEPEGESGKESSDPEKPSPGPGR